MPVPASQRVVYHKNPLVEVICQVRYPAFFRIEREHPVEFQNRLAPDFPVAQEKQVVTQIPPEMLPVLPEPVQRSLPLARAYDFISRDGVWIVSLTRDFLSLTTKSYRRWEDFRLLLTKCMDALQSVYNPPFYLRVGLRYQDVISRATLGLENVSWADLLNPAVAGELNDTHLAEDVVERFTVTLLRLPEHHAFARLQHGLVGYQREANTPRETCYLIDCDLFTERQTEVQDVYDVLDYLNRQAGNIFRWSISEKLHHALQPEPV